MEQHVDFSFSAPYYTLNELSESTTDIWIVCQGGAPIGVVEVKKPDENDTLRHAAVQGQLFDYMLRLQSFFGLQHVFGILTNYEQWRICWMPQADQTTESSCIALETKEKCERTMAAVPKVGLKARSMNSFI